MADYRVTDEDTGLAVTITLAGPKTAEGAEEAKRQAEPQLRRKRALFSAGQLSELGGPRGPMTAEQAKEFALRGTDPDMPLTGRAIEAGGVVAGGVAGGLAGGVPGAVGGAAIANLTLPRVLRHLYGLPQEESLGGRLKQGAERAAAGALAEGGGRALQAGARRLFPTPTATVAPSADILINREMARLESEHVRGIATIARDFERQIPEVLAGAQQRLTAGKLAERVTRTSHARSRRLLGAAFDHVEKELGPQIPVNTSRTIMAAQRTLNSLMPQFERTTAQQVSGSIQSQVLQDFMDRVPDALKPLFLKLLQKGQVKLPPEVSLHEARELQKWLGAVAFPKPRDIPLTAPFRRSKAIEMLHALDEDIFSSIGRDTPVGRELANAKAGWVRLKAIEQSKMFATLTGSKVERDRLLQEVFGKPGAKDLSLQPMEEFRAMVGPRLYTRAAALKLGDIYQSSLKASGELDPKKFTALIQPYLKPDVLETMVGNASARVVRGFAVQMEMAVARLSPSTLRATAKEALPAAGTAPRGTYGHLSEYGGVAITWHVLRSVGVPQLVAIPAAAMTSKTIRQLGARFATRPETRAAGEFAAMLYLNSLVEDEQPQDIGKFLQEVEGRPDVSSVGVGP